MEKNLPIKIFSKREKDIQSTEGRGGKQTRKWVLSGNALSARASYLSGKLNSFENRFDGKLEDDVSAPTVFRFKLNEKAISKEPRKEIGKLLNGRQKNNLIGMTGDNELIVKFDTKADFSEVLKRLERFTDFDLSISSLDDAQLFKPITNLDNDGSENVKIRLLDYYDNELNEGLYTRFESFCKENNISFKAVNYGNDLKIYSVSRACLDNLEELENFDGIYSITESAKVQLNVEGVKHNVKLKIKEPNA